MIFPAGREEAGEERPACSWEGLSTGAQGQWPDRPLNHFPPFSSLSLRTHPSPFTRSPELSPSNARLLP